MSPANEAVAASRPAAHAAPDRLGSSTRFSGSNRWSRWLQRCTQRHTLLLQDDALWDAGPARQPRLQAVRHAAFDDWCAGHPHVACEVLLSGMLVHELVCDPALPLAGSAAILDHARAVFGHYHGDGASDWPLAAWSAQGQHGVSALHGVDTGRLLAAARLHGVHLAALQPWWARVLSLALRRLPALRATPSAWLLIVEGRFATALQLQRGRCTQMRSQWLADRCPLALEAFAAMLRHELPAGGADVPVIAVGHGLAPGAAPGIQMLGDLEGAGPPCAWLVDRGLAV